MREGIKTVAFSFHMRQIRIILVVALILLSTSGMLRIISNDIHPNIKQWYLIDDEKRIVNIGWRDMWDLYESFNDSKKSIVRIAVIDTGADYSNSEIKDSLLNLGDYNIDNDIDNVGHGTKIIGIICASQYSGKVVGVADSKWVRIIPIKIVENSERMTCNTKDLVRAIHYAESQGCTICNISLNTDENDQELEDAISGSDMLFVVSAGNEETKGRNIDINPSYPASYTLKNLITVTNIKSNGRLNSKANFGCCVDIAAPGTEIFNVSILNKYDAKSGTSFAAPIVTGLAAMIFISIPDMTAKKCRDIILKSACEERRLNGKVDHNRLVRLNEAIKSAIN